MRRSLLSTCISYAINPASLYQKGPVSPYTSELNRQIYYRWLSTGKTLTHGHSLGKTYNWHKSYGGNHVR